MDSHAKVGIYCPNHASRPPLPLQWYLLAPIQHSSSCHLCDGLWCSSEGLQNEGEVDHSYQHWQEMRDLH